MDYQPRTIAFIAELVHPPVGIDPRPVQKLHNHLFQKGAPSYSSFQITPAGPLLSNPASRPGAVSQVLFGADRIVFREELSAMTWEPFAARVMELVDAVAPLRGIQVLTGTQITLRSLVNPRHWTDSRKFLQVALLGIEDELETLDRSPSLYGLRLAFPPEGEQTNAFGVRVESYTADTRSLFLEVQGTFNPVVVAKGLAPIEGFVHGSYRFLTDRVLPFVARFDAHQPS